MRKKLRELKLLNFIVIFFAGIINAVGVTLFLFPVDLYDSGFSGTSMLLDKLTPDYLSLSLFLLILNIPFFLYGYKKQGIGFTLYSLFAVAVYSVSSYVIQNIIFPNTAGASPFSGNDLFLCAIFGGIISGIGSGLTIRFGGAIDGVEVMAVIFAKQLGITVGTFVMVYNTLLYIIAGIITASWILPLYSVVAYCAAIKTIDFIVDGFDKAKSATIITKHEQEISSAICETFGHGVTLIDAHGFYSGTHKCYIYVVVNRFQIAKLKNIVKEIDPKAFVTISEVSDTLGSSIKDKPKK